MPRICAALQERGCTSTAAAPRTRHGIALRGPKRGFAGSVSAAWPAKTESVGPTGVLQRAATKNAITGSICAARQRARSPVCALFFQAKAIPTGASGATNLNVTNGNAMIGERVLVWEKERSRSISWPLQTRVVFFRCRAA